MPKKKPAKKNYPAQATKAALARKTAPAAPPSPAVVQPAVLLSKRAWWIILSSLGLLTVWAYWPTFLWMEDQWRNEPDYSHGYIVIPLGILLLYLRRDTLPAAAISVGWAGIGLMLLAIVLRVVGRIAYMDFLDGWSIVPWLAGMAWLLAGRKVMWWALPAIVFLIMLTPMPFRAESLLSFKLQGVATTLSTGALQTLGFAAIPEGNTIWLGEQQLMVEEACSGLRIFMGMVAMGFFFAVLSNRTWLDRLVIVASCIPIAILVNVLRVTGTGLAYHTLSPRWAHFAHDFLGILMIGAGALMLFGVKRYWEELYRPLEIAMIQRRLATGGLPPHTSQTP